MYSLTMGSQFVSRIQRHSFVAVLGVSTFQSDMLDVSPCSISLMRPIISTLSWKPRSCMYLIHLSDFHSTLWNKNL